MTVTLTLSGSGGAQAHAAALELLTSLTGEHPQEVLPVPATDQRRDLGLGIAIATLVLAAPGAVLAGLEIADRLRKRRELAPKIEAMKHVLEVTDSSATIRIETTVISINDMSTDQILDRLLPDR